MATIGDQIRKARERKGVSIKALAERMNIEEERLLDIESGKEEPGMYELACFITLIEFQFEPTKFQRPDWFLGY